MLLIVYLGYYILKRQEVERNRLEALAKAKPKSSSSSTNSGFNKIRNLFPRLMFGTAS